MRLKRILTRDAWYEVRTTVNNRESLFRRRQAIAVFCRVFGEAGKRFAFELRGFALEKERLSFYIRPADLLQAKALEGEASPALRQTPGRRSPSPAAAIYLL
jgi:hypothetical protein